MNIVIIGGGAAGMLAAISSRRDGNNVTLIEKNQKLGKKLAITGKGRCNITFEGDEKQFLENIAVNNKFLLSAYNKFSNNDVIEFFEENGVKTKVERGARIFPVSDNANDVVESLENILKKEKVNVIYNMKVIKINIDEKNDKKHVKSVTLENGKEIKADKIIIATGGSSYKVTGSTGDGYNLVKELGHSIIDISPGLIPLKCYGDVCSNLQGLSLKNVILKIIDIEKNKEIYSEFGEMLFAHFGITGPIVLSASSKLNRYKNVEEKIKNKKIQAVIDLKPALSYEQLDKRIQRDFEKYNNKEFKNSLDDLLPQKLIKTMIQYCKIDENKLVHQITKEERKILIESLKNFCIQISGFMPIDLAIITCGGVSTKEINPKTMESKLVEGLYFAGEIIDVDAYTGGYNLQIAFSTGYVAGKNVL